jgi:hypothetical protein
MFPIWHKISECLPPKGIDIVGRDANRSTYYCFRCACQQPNCQEWRCSVTGSALLIDLDEWTAIAEDPVKIDTTPWYQENGFIHIP